jgi:hypothetical protein
MPRPRSTAALPAVCDHTWTPSPVYLATKLSSPPTEVNVSPPNEA